MRKMLRKSIIYFFLPPPSMVFIILIRAWEFIFHMIFVFFIGASEYGRRFPCPRKSGKGV